MRSGLLLAALAVVMLAFAGTADAKKKKKKGLGPVVTATATASGSTAGQILTATATCPAKTKAVGGGFSVPPLPPSPVNTAVALASHKVGANQWLASTQIFGGSGPSVTMTTTAYCRKGAPATAPVTTSLALPQVMAVTPTEANASCLPKQVQLSGGFAIDNVGISLNVLLLSSNRAGPSTWLATALATQPGHTITSQADCAKQPKAKGKKAATSKKKKAKIVAPTETTGDSTSGSVAATVTAVATCPPKMSAVNGGFSQPGALQPTTGFFLITESQAVGNTWHVSGFNETSNPGTLRSYGYCSK
jgi:hypothetical protein